MQQIHKRIHWLILALVSLAACSLAAAEDDQTKLLAAVLSGQVEDAKRLIDAGVPFDKKDRRGMTLLHLAASAGPTEMHHRPGHTHVGELLIERGADIHARNIVGRTPLHFAAATGHKKLAKLLIAKGAGVNAVSDLGCNALGFCLYDLIALHRAPRQYKAYGIELDVVSVRNAMSSLSSTACLLIESGTNVNRRDPQGRTSLHIAASIGDADIVRCLVEKKADVDLKNKEGKTALDLAMEKGHKALISLLRQHGGKTGKELKE